MRRSRKRGHGQPCHQSFINRSAQAISRSTPGTWSRNAVLKGFLQWPAAGGSLGIRLLAAAMPMAQGTQVDREHDREMGEEQHDSLFICEPGCQ